MILFKKISYKNFLSCGNVPIEVQLDKYNSTLVVGSNGAGKSTMIEAIVFALFNKSFRKVNKNQLINSINNSDCLVEVEFQIGPNNWLVRRGMKPNIFEIHKNGLLQSQRSDVKDDQKFLEQTVLKLNYKSFTQIVILGSSTFIPFMQLPAAGRREVIEDLLDIKIFTTMNIILKERSKLIGEQLKTITSDLDLIKEKLEVQKKFIKELKTHSEKNISNKENKILQYEEEITRNEESLVQLHKQIEDKKEQLEQFGDVGVKIRDLESSKNQVLSEQKQQLNLQKFFEKNDSCPTCTQTITEGFKLTQIKQTGSKIKKHKTAVDKLEKEIIKITDIMNQKNSISSEINDLLFEVQKIIYSSEKLNKIKNDIRDEIAEIKNNSANIAVEEEKLNGLVETGIDMSKTYGILRSQKSNHDTVLSLLKDTGIKSQIVKKYLPVMNNLINKYLQMMDFYINFTFDDNFEEHILSTNKNDFSYTSFSEGEKMRIDLSLMFTWRAIAKLKNSANTNLLILDEVFDSSLDVAGTDDFMRIIRGIDKETNIFFISHKGDILVDKFERVLKFDKHKNFSRVEEKL